MFSIAPACSVHWDSSNSSQLQAFGLMFCALLALLAGCLLAKAASDIDTILRVTGAPQDTCLNSPPVLNDCVYFSTIVAGAVFGFLCMIIFIVAGIFNLLASDE